MQSSYMCHVQKLDLNEAGFMSPFVVSEDWSNEFETSSAGREGTIKAPAKHSANAAGDDAHDAELRPGSVNLPAVLV